MEGAEEKVAARRLAAVGGAMMITALAAFMPASASAAVRFAEPAGNGPEPCVEADPCEVQVAVESPAVQPGDEIVILPGDYLLGEASLEIAKAIDVHGAPNGPRPRLFSSDPNFAIFVHHAGARLSHVAIEYDDEFDGLTLSAGTATGVVAHGAGALSNACEIGNAVLRDTVCWATGGGRALVTVPGEATVRNVTAIATGMGNSGIDVGAISGGKATLEGRNVIADGDPDVSASTDSSMGASARISLDHSNFDTRDTSGSGASATAPGSGTNQTAPPQLVDQATGDFQQLSGSPTIDAGAADFLLGASDIDGQPRIQGVAPDIGADEFTVGPPPDGGLDTDPPETTIVKGPKKKTTKRTAKFEFASDEPGSTFQCKLDKKDFAPCAPPFEQKVKRRKHKFQVAAVDPAGNVDPTPAKRKWKVR